MNIRRATEADESILRELWEEFEHDVPEPPGADPQTWADEWPGVRANLEHGAVYLAEDDAGPVGVVEAVAPKRKRSHVVLVYVRPRARRQGIAKALLLECVREVKEKGATLVSLDVVVGNTAARTVWQRLGFEDVQIAMAMPLDALAQRLALEPSGASRAATHVQSDDTAAIDRALAQFVPRLAEPDVRATGNGWIRIASSLTDGDRDVQSRFAREVSERIGGVVVALRLEHDSVVRFQLYERGRMVDEYLSVPTFYGDLSKADELALAANPTLIARLTGADRDEVKRVARTAASPAGLPPAPELFAQIAAVLGVEP